MKRRGRRGSFWKRFLIKKNLKKEKRRAFISFNFNIYINRSFFSSAIFHKSFFFLPLRSIFPCKYFSFCLFLCVFSSPPYHTSHSESLDVTDRMDVPVSTLSAILETLVVGLAAVDGDSAELWGVRPASDRDLIPLGPIAWCWSLEKKRSQEGGGEEKKSEKWQLDLRMSHFPSSSCKIGVQTRLSFPLPAPAMHACFYQIASFQGTKHGPV